jgi:hypothetical protein
MVLFSLFNGLAMYLMTASLVFQPESVADDVATRMATEEEESAAETKAMLMTQPAHILVRPRAHAFIFDPNLTVSPSCAGAHSAGCHRFPDSSRRKRRRHPSVFTCKLAHAGMRRSLPSAAYPGCCCRDSTAAVNNCPCIRCRTSKFPNESNIPQVLQVSRKFLQRHPDGSVPADVLILGLTGDSHMLLGKCAQNATILGGIAHPACKLAGTWGRGSTHQGGMLFRSMSLSGVYTDSLRIANNSHVTACKASD